MENTWYVKSSSVNKGITACLVVYSTRYNPKVRSCIIEMPCVPNKSIEDLEYDCMTIIADHHSLNSRSDIIKVLFTHLGANNVVLERIRHDDLIVNGKRYNVSIRYVDLRTTSIKVYTTSIYAYSKAEAEDIAKDQIFMKYGATVALLNSNNLN